MHFSEIADTLPVRDAGGTATLYVVDLKAKKEVDLGTARIADSPRLSCDGRYLAILTDAGFVIYDTVTKRRQVLGAHLADLAWSPCKDILFIGDRLGGLSAYDPASASLLGLSSRQTDDLIGMAYEHSLVIRQSLPTTEVSPSRKWAFVGALAGGVTPLEFNGQLSMDVGPRSPYVYAFIDSRWRLNAFSAPKAYENEDFHPAGWTASEELVMVNLDLPDKVMIVNPATGKTRMRELTPPVKGAVLVAVKDWRFF